MKHVEKPLCIISPCNLHLVERNTQTTWVHNKLLLYWSILHGKNNPAATCCLWFTIRWAQSPGLNGVKTIYGFVKWVTEAITPICYKWSEKSNPTYIGHPGCSFAHPQYAQYARLEFPHLFWSNYNISPTQISWKKEISLTIHHHLRWELVFGRYNFWPDLFHWPWPPLSSSSLLSWASHLDTWSLVSDRDLKVVNLPLSSWRIIPVRM